MGGGISYSHIEGLFVRVVCVCERERESECVWEGWEVSRFAQLGKTPDMDFQTTNPASLAGFSLAALAIHKKGRWEARARDIPFFSPKHTSAYCTHHTPTMPLILAYWRHTPPHTTAYSHIQTPPFPPDGSGKRAKDAMNLFSLKYLRWQKPELGQNGILNPNKFRFQFPTLGNKVQAWKSC